MHANIVGMEEGVISNNKQGTTISSTETELRALKSTVKQLRALIAQTGGTGTTTPVPTTKKGGKSDGPRQYKFYCWTHGYNLRHDSKNCPTNHPNPKQNRAADHDETATHSDHKKGSNRNRDRYLMWYHGRNNVRDTREG